MTSVNPDNVKRLLRLSLKSPWSIDDSGMLTGSHGTPFMAVWPQYAKINAHELVTMAPDLAAAYLAEHKRADVAEAERDELRSDLSVLLAGLFSVLGVESASVAEIVNSVGSLAARVTELESELSQVDAVLARRPALDQPTRRQNIEKAIRFASKADSAERKLARQGLQVVKIAAERDALAARVAELEAAAAPVEWREAVVDLLARTVDTLNGAITTEQRFALADDIDKILRRLEGPVHDAEEVADVG